MKLDKNLKINGIIDSLPEQKVSWGAKLIQANKAWEHYKGEGVKIGIVDTGIDADHVDLAPNVKDFKSFIDSTNGSDANFHGTHVTGIAAGADKDQGIIGVAPKAEIYSAKIFNKNDEMTATAERKALEWLAQENVNVINMSYGGIIPKDIPGGEKSIRKYHDLIKELYNAGIKLVAAAGNMGSKDGMDRVAHPARFPEVIAVGAIDEDKELAEFSSQGDAIKYGMPGVEVISCYPGDKYARFSGTSQAAPYLTGVIGLLDEYAKEKNGKYFTPEETKKELNKYAKEIQMEDMDISVGNGLVKADKITPPECEEIVKTDVAPFIKNKRTFLPVRAIGEALKADVHWIEDEKKVIVKTNDRKVVMWIGSKEIKIVNL